MTEKALPEFGPDYEFEVALRLINGNPLDLRILRALVGRPHRYNQLALALHLKNAETLTRALRRLTDLALIDQFAAGKHSSGRRYELNALGIAVLFAIARLQPVQRMEELLEAYLRAKVKTAAEA